jgi:hypothetical protein
MANQENQILLKYLNYPIPFIFFPIPMPQFDNIRQYANDKSHQIQFP